MATVGFGDTDAFFDNMDLLSQLGYTLTPPASN